MEDHQPTNLAGGGLQEADENKQLKVQANWILTLH
jgi:hypothetical protein